MRKIILLALLVLLVAPNVQAQNRLTPIVLQNTTLDTLIGTTVDSVMISLVRNGIYPEFVFVVTNLSANINNGDTTRISINQGSFTYYEGDSYSNMGTTAGPTIGNITFVDSKAAGGAATRLKVKTANGGNPAATDSVSYKQAVIGVYSYPPR